MSFTLKSLASFCAYFKANPKETWTIWNGNPIILKQLCTIPEYLSWCSSPWKIWPLIILMGLLLFQISLTQALKERLIKALLNLAVLIKLSKFRWYVLIYRFTAIMCIKKLDLFSFVILKVSWNLQNYTFIKHQLFLLCITLFQVSLIRLVDYKVVGFFPYDFYILLFGSISH